MNLSNKFNNWIAHLGEGKDFLKIQKATNI